MHKVVFADRLEKSGYLQHLGIGLLSWCGDLAGKPKHLDRTLIDSVGVEGDVNNVLVGSCTPGDFHSFQRAPLASEPSLQSPSLLSETVHLVLSCFAGKIVTCIHISLCCSWNEANLVFPHATAILDLQSTPVL